jgi:DNA-directed RNA polymerase subunit omega
VSTPNDTLSADQAEGGAGYIGSYDTPLGITNPPIDELLDRTSSKYALVIYAAKRARQINDYYNQLGDGILEYVGPLVEPGLQEKPLSIAMREIHGDLLEHAEGE